MVSLGPPTYLGWVRCDWLVKKALCSEERCPGGHKVAFTGPAWMRTSAKSALPVNGRHHKHLPPVPFEHIGMDLVGPLPAPDDSLPPADRRACGEI
ncbi:hypothetical protein QQF64_003343 [Cirrhinus molitorella]|uniref:Uncharacterized protein n=1 Tax=Cirrhinus molitorella TaxID=172907 RepID=A0ABR3ML11_9TELE